MEIWPAIDIRGGQCVRLVQGDYNRETVYSSAPADMAEHWASLGAKHLHLVDLDGAKDGRILTPPRLPRSFVVLRFLQAGVASVTKGDPHLPRHGCQPTADRHARLKEKAWFREMAQNTRTVLSWGSTPKRERSRSTAGSKQADFAVDLRELPTFLWPRSSIPISRPTA